ncbi:helix-turn-helix domain-containing protein [Mycobacterium sp.]|uniref:helix-turn-helix domain-containing protein n=1 Tax=Mycobacterium sp. TaxID=1785 RepID=UPI003BAE6DF2
MTKTIIKPSLAKKNAALDDRLISVTDTCAYLGISRATFYTMLTDGRLRAYKIGRTIRVRMSDIESALLPYGGVDVTG